MKVNNNPKELKWLKPTSYNLGIAMLLVIGLGIIEGGDALIPLWLRVYIVIAASLQCYVMVRLLWIGSNNDLEKFKELRDQLRAENDERLKKDIQANKEMYGTKGTDRTDS